ncbi:hypothetical protein NWT09_31080 [Mycolicibacterium sp. jd]|uniref:hypothetical protein n=1 Tax=unclassified Mycolicibacterium TaxID=2636767 RepID=UPI00351B69EE
MINDVHHDDLDREPPRYLLLDDHGARVRVFENQVSGRDVEVMTMPEAIELEEIKHDLEVLEGAIVDFHLNTPTRPGYTYLRYPCAEPDCPNLAEAGASPEDSARALKEHAWHVSAGIPSVDVTTGLGAMLYIKQHAPGTALYGFCELNAKHSLLFLLAARVWLGASAINAEYPPDQIRQALTSDSPEDHLPINKDLANAAPGFEQLTDSLKFLTRQPEAFDWLNVYRAAGYRSTRAEFKALLEKHYGIKTLESDLYIKIVCTWQAALHRMLTAFRQDTGGWPDLRNVDSAAHWNDNNPVLDFLKDRDYQTFFTAPDTRAALAYYRADMKRRSAEDPLGGY